MRLLSNPMSPYGRKVMVVVREHGLEDRVALVETHPRTRQEEVTAHSPIGKIPVLLLDDGRALRDSPVIAEYLDAEFGNSRLLPASGPGRWLAMTRMADADGAIEAAILVRNERLRPQERQSPEWIDWQMDKVRRTVGAWEAEADALAGAWDLGLISIGCALGYLPRRLPEYEGLAGLPRLAELYEELMKRPAFAQTA